MVALSTLLDFVYPRRCGGCGVPMEHGSGHLCWECLVGISLVTEPFCSLCGDPVEGRVEHEYLCSFCAAGAPRFDRARSAARYRGSLRRAIHAFKYEHATCMQDDLVSLLATCVRVHYPGLVPDAVVAVPLHAQKERSRTYNQSQLLAAGLARALSVHATHRVLKRVRPTSTQTKLTAAERRRNVAGAFATTHTEWVEGRCLLLVDDVMTTGATVRECSRVLKQAGAAGVYVVTVARG